MIIPNNFMVIIADDSNYRRAVRYNIVGPKEVPNLKKYILGGPIKKIIVVNTNNKIIFWERDNFSGYAYSLSYGKNIIPDEFQFAINSINIQIPQCKISMFFNNDFTNLYNIIDNTSLDKKNISYMDNDRPIKSIIIEHID
jgi:hypothetical protein